MQPVNADPVSQAVLKDPEEDVAEAADRLLAEAEAQSHQITKPVEPKKIHPAVMISIWIACRVFQLPFMAS